MLQNSPYVDKGKSILLIKTISLLISINNLMVITKLKNGQPCTKNHKG